MSINRNLFELLLGNPERVQQAIVAICKVNGWQDAIALAEAWRVLPRLAKVVREQQIVLSASNAQELQTKVITYATQSGYVARRAGELAQMLEDKKVEALAFKGVATLARLHRSPAGRMLSDIDLIVREQDLELAIQVIQMAGFCPRLEVTDQRKMAEQRVLKDNTTINLIDAEGLGVDLHYNIHGNILGLSGDDLWQRAELIPLLHRHVRIVSPTDAMLLATHHSLRSNFLPLPTIRDLGDIADYWHSNQCTWQVSMLATTAQKYGLETPLLAMCGILAQVGNISDTDERLFALKKTLNTTNFKDAMWLEQWFFESLDRPGFLKAVYDISIFNILSNPPTLVRLVWNRVMGRIRFAKQPWHRKLVELRKTHNKSAIQRMYAGISNLISMNRYQLYALWKVTRIKSRVFSSKPNVQ